MVSRIYNLKVFVASPSDVNEERVLLEQVVNELNKLPGEKLGVRLDLVKWETDTYPGFGIDAQSVINEQIGSDYDIFIGVLWKRFGTPTNRAESGTVEEFNNAYQKALKDPDKIRIMFYFNETPSTFTDIDDVEQLKKVLTFRKSLGEKGVYYWSYKKTEDFQTFARLHLGKAMEGFGTDWGYSVELEDKTKNSSAEIQENLEIEEGFLDLIIRSVDDMNLASESINRLGGLLNKLNEKTRENTVKLEGLSKPINPNLAKPLINDQADVWESFAKSAEDELPILSSKFRSGLEAYAKASQITSDFKDKNIEQLEEGLSAITTLRNSVIKALESNKNFRDVIQSTPRMTTRLNRAKRYLIDILNKILEEYEAEIDLSIEAEKIVKSMIQKGVSKK